MGRGRDGDVAVLKLAAEGRPCLRLRDVLKTLDAEDREPHDDADQLLRTVEAVGGPIWNMNVRAAADLGPPLDFDTRVGPTEEPEPVDAQFVARVAALPVVQALAGEALEDNDFDDLNRIGNIMIERLAREPVPDDLGLDLRHGSIMSCALAVLQGVPSWLDEATMLDLAKGVQAARGLLDSFTAIDARAWDLPDEERWRWIGRLAPLAFALIPGLMRPIITAVLGSLGIPDGRFTDLEREFLTGYGISLPDPQPLANGTSDV
jgi:hypothetical protein